MNMRGLLYALPSTDEYNTQEYVPVPLTRVNIKARVVNFITEVEVVQEYQNKEKDPIEVIYFFPVEEEAAVTGCSAELEGRNVVAEIKETEQAQKLYNEAVKEKKTAFLLEETKTDIFQLKIGNLSPGAGCSVKITYLMELPVEDGKSCLTIPTTIAPRYVPAEDGSEVAKKISSIGYDFSSPAPLHLELDILMRTKISSVTSPSHQISTVMENRTGAYYAALTKFEGTTTDMDRDIIVLIDSEEPNQPKIVLEKGDDGSIAGLLTMVPNFELKKQQSEIVFLIDCSGSMGGQSMQLAKQALQLFIHSLPVDSYFNIFCFGSSYTKLFPHSQQLTDESLDSAKQLVQGLAANLGGTEIYQPLQAILSSSAVVGKPRQVFVLTDGQVSNTEQCINLVEEHNNNNRVFTLGIGASADRHLVKGMARVDRGVPSFTTYGENIAGKVMKLLKQSLQPCVHEVQVQWTAGQAADIESSQAPLRAPPVYDGTRLLLYKLWGEAGGLGDRVTITAKTPEGDLSLDVKIDQDSFIEGEMVHKMFARKMIQELEENYERKDPAEVKTIITELGLKYSLGSKYTAFIAVDTQTHQEAAVKTRQVRNQLPYGYGGLDMRRSRMGLLGAPGAASPMLMMRSVQCCSASMSESESESESEFGSQSRSRSREKECARMPHLRASVAKRMSAGGSPPSRRQCAYSKESEECIRKVPKSNMDKIVALTSTQTAAGYFREDAIVETVIGEKFAVFQKECQDKSIDTRIWVTALIIAFIMKSFPDEKDSWELIVDKAQDWLENNALILRASECLSD